MPLRNGSTPLPARRRFLRRWAARGTSLVRLPGFTVAVVAVAIAVQLGSAVHTAQLIGPTEDPVDIAAFDGGAVVPVSDTAAAAPVATELVPPVRIDIPAAGVTAPVDAVDLNDDGTMEVPTDYARTGWYRRLEAPGETGTAVIVGHLDSTEGPAVFHRLEDLEPGAEIVVTRADGTAVTFLVDRSETFSKKEFPSISVYAPSPVPSLRLITCGGEFDRRRKSYESNTVVYATAKGA